MVLKRMKLECIFLGGMGLLIDYENMHSFVFIHEMATIITFDW